MARGYTRFYGYLEFDDSPKLVQPTVIARLHQPQLAINRVRFHWPEGLAQSVNLRVTDLNEPAGAADAARGLTGW